MTGEINQQQVILIGLIVLAIVTVALLSTTIILLVKIVNLSKKMQIFSCFLPIVGVK